MSKHTKQYERVLEMMSTIISKRSQLKEGKNVEKNSEEVKKLYGEAREILRGIYIKTISEEMSDEDRDALKTAADEIDSEEQGAPDDESFNDLGDDEDASMDADAETLAQELLDALGGDAEEAHAAIDGAGGVSDNDTAGDRDYADSEEIDEIASGLKESFKKIRKLRESEDQEDLSADDFEEFKVDDEEESEDEEDFDFNFDDDEDEEKDGDEDIDADEIDDGDDEDMDDKDKTSSDDDEEDVDFDKLFGDEDITESIRRKR